MTIWRHRLKYLMYGSKLVEIEGSSVKIRWRATGWRRAYIFDTNGPKHQLIYIVTCTRTFYLSAPRAARNAQHVHDFFYSDFRQESTNIRTDLFELDYSVRRIRWSKKRFFSINKLRIVSAWWHFSYSSRLVYITRDRLRHITLLVPFSIAFVK